MNEENANSYRRLLRIREYTQKAKSNGFSLSELDIIVDDSKAIFTTEVASLVKILAEQARKSIARGCEEGFTNPVSVSCPCGCENGFLQSDCRNEADNLTFLICNVCNCTYVANDFANSLTKKD